MLSFRFSATTSNTFYTRLDLKEKCPFKNIISKM